MGYGDEIIGTGLARGAFERGKRIAFGDGKKILHGPWCADMFRNNPNIAHPGSEHFRNLEWVEHYKGHRLYNKQVNGRWVWNYEFKVRPGEFYFSGAERNITATVRRKIKKGYVVIEPNLPWQKSVWPNKDWGEENYQRLAAQIHASGFQVLQLIHKNSRRRLGFGSFAERPKFRDAIAMLAAGSLYIGPEGGMHHAAAAVGLPAVVLMGGFIPPSVVGYEGHVNLTGGAEACGNIEPCDHCAKAMKRITVDEVLQNGLNLLVMGKEVSEPRRQPAS